MHTLVWRNKVGGTVRHMLVLVLSAIHVCALMALIIRSRHLLMLWCRHLERLATTRQGHSRTASAHGHVHREAAGRLRSHPLGCKACALRWGHEPRHRGRFRACRASWDETLDVDIHLDAACICRASIFVAHLSTWLVLEAWSLGLEAWPMNG